jgi:hypothetical protein
LNRYIPDFGFLDMDPRQAIEHLLDDDDETEDDRLESVLKAYLEALDNDQRACLENRIARYYLTEEAHARGLGFLDAANAVAKLRCLAGIPQRDPQGLPAVRGDTKGRKIDEGYLWLDNSTGREVIVVMVGVMGHGEHEMEPIVAVRGVHGDDAPMVYTRDYFLGETRHGDGQWRPRFVELKQAPRSGR